MYFQHLIVLVHCLWKIINTTPICPPVRPSVYVSVGLSVSRLSVCSLVIGPVINQSVIAKTIQIVLEKFACDNMKYDFAVKQLHVFTISSRLAESKHTTCKVVHCFQITDTFLS